MDSYPSQTHQLADIRERSARLEERTTNHHRILASHHALLQECRSTSLETAASVRLLRSEISDLRRTAVRPVIGLSEATLKLILAVALPLVVLLLTKDPQSAADTARSLLPGGGGH